MKVLCAWCGTVLQDGEAEGRPISHGICGACSSNIEFQEGVKLRKYLDSLELPVLAVDSDVVVKIANGKALALLGKNAEAVGGKRGGNVFECEHARLPGGCGRKLHCSGCAIRRTVTETWQTGKPAVSVPAILNHAATAGKEAISLRISTEKIGEMVFLRIDRMEQQG